MNWLSLLLGMITGVSALGTFGDCTPDIRIIRSDSTLNIEGACVAPDDGALQELQYELIVDRIGTAGTTRSRQGGTFTTGTSSADTLSSTSINFAPGDSLHVRLTIYSGEEVVGSTEIRRELE